MGRKEAAEREERVGVLARTAGHKIEIDGPGNFRTHALQQRIELSYGDVHTAVKGGSEDHVSTYIRNCLSRKGNCGCNKQDWCEGAGSQDGASL